MQLEDLTPNTSVRGILPDTLVTVVNVQWFGSEALELTYKDPGGRVANQLLYRHDEPRLGIVEQGRPWSFDGDGSLLRLVSEAHRIRLAHLFDPVLAVHTSLVDPLPHQITAVYEEMLPRQPLRFLLADDPGAGKTIMAGLLIKELIVRGDLQRCLVVCPGSLVDQWQDELYRRFQLPFEILTNHKLEAARTGNWFLENNLVIARLNVLDRQSPRNRRIADVFTKCGLVERSGQGMNLMFEQSIRDGKARPDFTGTDSYHVKLTLYGEVGDPRFVQFIDKVGQETLSGFDTHDFLILDLVHREVQVPVTLQLRLKRLVDLGVVEIVGRGKGTRYLLSRRFYSMIGKSGAYTRRRGLDRETNKELLLKHIRENSEAGASLGDLIEVLPALNRRSVQDLLNSLRKEDRIKLQGKTRAARWFPVNARK